MQVINIRVYPYVTRSIALIPQGRQILDMVFLITCIISFQNYCNFINKLKVRRNHHEKKYMLILVKNMFFTGTNGPLYAGLLQKPLESDVLPKAQRFCIPGEKGAHVVVFWLFGCLRFDLCLSREKRRGTESDSFKRKQEDQAQSNSG